MDREKVIGHLGILWTWCAVNPAYGRGLDVEECGRAVGWLDDAIEMMQAEGEREATSSVSAGGAATFPKGEGSGEAQEPVEPTIGGDADGPCGNWWYQCGKCKEAIDYHDRYCRNCGQAVKWE